MFKFRYAHLFFLSLLTLSSQVGRVYAQDDASESSSVEDFLQNLSSVPKVLDRRDPFQEGKPSFLKEEKVDSGVDEATARISGDEIPPLERYALEQYAVKAVLLGDQYPRALLKTPDGMVAIVKENSRLGDKNGVIEKIDRNGIQVLEKIRNTFGSFDNVSQTLPVGGVK